MSDTRAGRKVKSLLPADDEIEKALAEALRGDEASAREPEAAELADIRPNSMACGRVMLITNDQVIVDLKYKSEGIIARDEFPEPGPEIRSEVEA